jgi:YVTN family beta-propeller protein
MKRIRNSNSRFSIHGAGVLSIVGIAFLAAALASILFAGVEAKHQKCFTHPTYSSPITLSRDNKLLWSVNPADDSVSVIRTDTNTLLTNIKVGKEPQSIALDPYDRFAYVADAAGSDVTVIKIVNRYPDTFKAEVECRAGKNGHIKSGAEPWNIVASPDGKRIFVANSAQDTITVIDAKWQTVIGSVDLRNSLCNDPDHNRHFQPRGLAVTQDSKKLYVTRFLSFTRADGVQGDDKGKEGLVCRLDIDTNSTDIGSYHPAAVIRLEPRIIGFKHPNLPDEDTLGFPNQMQNIVIRGDQAYLPNIAASPTDPLRF